MTRFLLAKLFCLVGQVSLAQHPDTDGDGLLDLVDVEGFEPSASVTFADFSEKGIQDLDGVTLLSNVERLFLRFNRLASIESGDFEGLGNLQSLDLGGNQLTNVESGAFQWLSNLKSLDLRSNQLTSVESGDFQWLSNLQLLALGGNQLTSVESGAFQWLSNLQVLSLSSNQLSSISLQLTAPTENRHEV